MLVVILTEIYAINPAKYWIDGRRYGESRNPGAHFRAGSRPA
jgi:hypothetical protein